MTKGITGKEPDPRVVYADIIDLPRHESDHHPAMSLYDRAAQFSPYAALSGYDDMVREEELEQLNRKLNRISRMIASGTKPVAAVTYFVPDPLKAGGRYETIEETIRKVDPVSQTVVLEKKAGISGARMAIRIADILDIQ